MSNWAKNIEKYHIQKHKFYADSRKLSANICSHIRAF